MTTNLGKMLGADRGTRMIPPPRGAEPYLALLPAYGERHDVLVKQ